MDETGLFFLCVSASCFLFLVFLAHVLNLRGRIRNRNLPPSPPSLPVIGHLHLLKEPIHRALRTLSDRYGPILSLAFGSRTVVVVSSSSAVEECFTKNDIILANRPRLLAGKYLAYNYTTLATASYGDHWRNLRRLTAHKLLSPKCLSSLSNIRCEEARFLVKNLYEDTKGGTFARVELRPRLQELSFNTIMRMVSGKHSFGGGNDVEKVKRFRETATEMFELAGASDPVDFVPVLRLVDFRGIEKRMAGAQGRSDGLLQGLINEYRASENKRSCGDGGIIRGERETIIDSMLRLQASEPENYSDDIIKGQILTLLMAGTDTSALTVEWAMSLLLNNPGVIKKARAEVDEIVGQGRLVNEADIQNLRYIQHIINEALRLFPPAPLFVPHEASSDCMIGGFRISKGSMLLVNAWAIHRDPSLWDDPESFKPERFENWEGDAYRLIPFGMGRRSCPGAGLANRLVGLALAVLIQCFEWERVGEELVDLSEGSGLTMPKLQPLVVLCRARKAMIPILLAQI